MAEDNAQPLFFDAHCHLQSKKIMPVLDSVLNRAWAAGVAGMACCATCEEDWNNVERIAANEKKIIPFFGIHPWYLEKLSAGWQDRLEALLLKTGGGIGETGLDHAVKDRNDSLQETVFKEQLKLAIRLKRPVSVHCRKAWEALLRIVENEGGLACPGLIHSYSGPAELVPALEKAGFYLSFSGALTRTRNRRGHASLRAASKNLILIETDSPDLTPTGLECDFNEPANILHVAGAMSEILGMTLEETAMTTTKNACNLFNPLLK